MPPTPVRQHYKEHDILELKSLPSKAENQTVICGCSPEKWLLSLSLPSLPLLPSLLCVELDSAVAILAFSWLIVAQIAYCTSLGFTLITLSSQDARDKPLSYSERLRSQTFAFHSVLQRCLCCAPHHIGCLPVVHQVRWLTFELLTFPGGKECANEVLLW